MDVLGDSMRHKSKGKNGSSEITRSFSKPKRAVLRFEIDFDFDSFEYKPMDELLLSPERSEWP